VSVDRSAPWAEQVLDTLAHSSDLLIVADAGLVIQFASRGALDLLGYEPAQVVGRNGIDFLHPDDVSLFAAVAAKATQGYVPRSAISYRLRHSDGSYVSLELAGGPVLAEDRAQSFWLVGRRPERSEIYAEVLHRLLAEEPLATALHNVGQAMIPEVGSKFGITLWSPGEPVISVGHQLPDLLTGAEPRPGSPWDQARRTGLPQLSMGLSGLDPEISSVAESEQLSNVTVIPASGLDGTVVATITHWTPPGYPHPDASSEMLDRTRELVEAAIRLRQQVEQLKLRAATDPLTGLANRRAIDDAMEQMDSTIESSVIYLDLDGFKQVNDTHGHAMGDEVLRVVGKRIQSLVRADDLVARLGGDEFAILCAHCGRQDAARLSSRILEALRDPIVLQGVTLKVSASIGMSTSLGIDQEAFRQADQALYRAKHAGRDTARAS